MAHDTINYRDRIIENPNTLIGKPVVKGTGVLVERIIRHLAENPDLDDLFAAFPDLSREDVQAALAYAYAKVADPPRIQSPSDFYQEATQRADIRRILTELTR
jgi:uncharacterized protein (DUF433 family)